MSEAVFKFRSTGDVVKVTLLSVDYGVDEPSENWCHDPDVLKIEEDPLDNLYELRFPLSPFNKPENGKLTRTCVAEVSIYIRPNLNVPAITTGLTIEQIACLDKLNCGDLLDLISVEINTDEECIGPDGGVIEVERNNHDTYFSEKRLTILDEHGNTCSWAGYDDDGNITIGRRYFDDGGDSVRTATIGYEYTILPDYDIDDSECSDTFTGLICQRARTCEEADIDLAEKYTVFPKSGGERKLTDIVSLVGKDAGAFEIRSASDIVAWGGAFFPGGEEPSSSVVDYSALCGYTVTVLSNDDDDTDLLEDKIGFLSITYHNKYLIGCDITKNVTVRVNGMTCSELLEHVSIAIKINDEGDFITDSDLTISYARTSFTVYILGDSYAEKFDIDEDKCVIPSSIIIEGATFTIPENTDPYWVKKYKFKFVAGMIDDRFRDYSTYGCSFEKEFTFTQQVYQHIDNIGILSAEDIVACETIEGISNTVITVAQECEAGIEQKSNTVISVSQACSEITPMSDTTINVSQACENVSPIYSGEISINTTCESISVPELQLDLEQSCQQ